MFAMLRVFLFLGLSFFFSHCGGGGGGSSSSSSSPRGLRVLHAGVELAPVDVRLSSDLSLFMGSNSFSQSALRTSFPEGAGSFILTRANTPNDVLGRFSLPVEPKERYSLLVFGDVGSFGTQMSFFPDGSEEISGTALRLIHGLVGASELQLDIAGAMMLQAAFGGASEYGASAPGVHRIVIKRKTDGREIVSRELTLVEDTQYSFFVFGELDYLNSSRLLIDE